MKFIRTLFLMIWMIAPIQAWAASPLSEPLTPLPRVPVTLARQAEGTPHCYAGYGTQNLTFKIEGESVHSDKTTNPYQPGFDLTSTTFLRFGCKNDLLFLDFSTVDDSMRFNKTVTYKGDLYNTIRFKYRVFAIGHVLSVIPHRLYLDLGVGYAMLDYSLGLYGSQYGSGIESDTISTGNLLLRTSARVIINHYVMIHWQHDKSINSESVVDYSGELGLNFIARF